EVELDRVLHVLERVVEPGMPSIAEFGVDPEQHGGSEHDDEQAVPGPGAGGEGAEPCPAGLPPGGWPGSPRRWLRRRGRGHYPQAVPSCAGLLSPEMNKRPVRCVRPSPTVVRRATRTEPSVRIR